MTHPRSTSRDLTDKEYLRECTLRNPAFIKARREFLKRWESEPDLFAEPIVLARKAERGKGLDAIKEQQRRQGRFWSELITLCNDWPSITPNDVIGGASTTPGPKVRLAPYSPGTWPRDGSLLLCVHPTVTGIEFKRSFQKIKKNLRLVRHGKATPQTHETSPKVRFVKRVGQSGNESIFLSVTPAATGDDAKREFHKIKRAVSRRRLRLGSLQLKLSVYDMYVDEGKSFRQIARVARKHPSTVFDLFASACRDIGRIGRSSREMRLDPLFNHQEHFSTCPSCQKGWACKLAAEKIGLPSLNPMLSKIPHDDKVDIVTLQNQGRKPRRKIEY